MFALFKFVSIFAAVKKKSSQYFIKKHTSLLTSIEFQIETLKKSMAR
jgi:hypothetical protein